MLSPRSPSRHIGSPVLKLRGFAKAAMSRRAFSSSEPKSTLLSSWPGSFKVATVTPVVRGHRRDGREYSH
jgi:hypothetical protein